MNPLLVAEDAMRLHADRQRAAAHRHPTVSAPISPLRVAVGRALAAAGERLAGTR